MMIPFLMASLLVSTPDQAILDEASALGRDMFMGQLCEVLEVATFNGDALLVHGKALETRAQAANLPANAIDTAATEAHSSLMAEFEARYPAGKEDEARTTLTVTCQELITSRPAYFSAFQAD
jgi:hypothetical protein